MFSRVFIAEIKWILLAIMISFILVSIINITTPYTDVNLEIKREKPAVRRKNDELSDNTKIAYEKTDTNKPTTTNIFFIPGLDMSFPTTNVVKNRPKD